MSALKLWVLGLWAYLLPGVEGPGDETGDDSGDADDAGDDGADDASDAGDSADAAAGGADDAGDGADAAGAAGDAGRSASSGRQSRPAAHDFAEMRRQTEEAQRLARESKQKLDELALQQQGPTPEQILWQKEEARLAAQDTTDLERWQIDSSRRMRELQRNANAALAQSADMSDKAQYLQKGLSNPLYAKYADRVEAQLKMIRAKGGNVEREFILDKLMGEDLRTGKFQRPAAPAKKAPVTPRGRPSGARSDIPARMPADARAKRYERLKDLPI